MELIRVTVYEDRDEQDIRGRPQTVAEDCNPSITRRYAYGSYPTPFESITSLRPAKLLEIRGFLQRDAWRRSHKERAK